MAKTSSNSPNTNTNPTQPTQGFVDSVTGVAEELAKLEQSFARFVNKNKEFLKDGGQGMAKLVADAKKYKELTEKSGKFHKETAQSLDRVSASLSNQLDLEEKLLQAQKIHLRNSKKSNVLRKEETGAMELSIDFELQLGAIERSREATLRRIDEAKAKKNKALVSTLNNEKSILDAQHSRLTAQKKELDIMAQIAEVEAQQQKTITEKKEKIDTVISAIQSVLSGSLSVDTVLEKVKENFSSMGISIWGGAGLIVGMTLLAKRFAKVDEDVAKMGREFGGTNADVLKMNTNLTYSAANTQLMGAGLEEFRAAATETTKVFGTTAGLSQSILESQVFLTKELGLQGDAATDAIKFSKLQNKSVGQVAKGIQNQVQAYNEVTGAGFNIRDIQKEVLGTSERTKASYQGSAEELAKAALQAKSLGVNLAQAEGIADNLLDIESSISSEMEASILTGKSVNLSRARELALMGKTAEAAEEVLKQTGSYNELSKMNVIQQQSLARAAGQSLEEFLAGAKQRALYEELNIKRGGQLSEIDKQRMLTRAKTLGIDGDSLLKAQQHEQATSRLAALGEKLLNLFDAFAVGPLTKLTDGLASGLEYLDKMRTKFTELIPKPLLKSITTVGQLAGGGALLGVLGMVGKGLVQNAMGMLKPTLGTPKNPMSVTLAGEGGASGGGGIEDSISDMLDDEGGGDEGDDKKKKKKRGRRGRNSRSRRASSQPRDSRGRFTRGPSGGGKKNIFKNLLNQGKGLFKKGGLGKMGKGLLGKVGGMFGKGALGSVGSVAGKAGGLLGKVGKFANPLGLVAGVAGDYLLDKGAKAAVAGGNTKAAGFADAGKEALKWGALGATVGSIIPGVGTLVGGGLGAAIGGGVSLYKNFFQGDEESRRKRLEEMYGPESESVEDFILRPGQKPIKFRKDDMLIGGTNLMGEKGGTNNQGGASSTDVDMKELLKTLKSIEMKMSAPVNIQIGTNTVKQLTKVQTINRNYAANIDRR